MDSEYRFKWNEISRILKRAAELELKHDVDDDSEGLTADELHEISEEVGLHPQYLKQALDEVKHNDQSSAADIFGGPFTYRISETVEGPLTDEKWEDIVSEIRHMHGGIGDINKRANTYEWENHEADYGYTQISLNAKNNRTKITINARYIEHASIIYCIPIIISIPVLAIFFNSVSVPVIYETLIALTGVTGIFAGARFFLTHWMQNKRKDLSRIFQRIREILNPGKESETAYAQIAKSADNASIATPHALNQRRQQTS